MSTKIQEAFEAIGAAVEIAASRDVFEIDVRRSSDHEAFCLSFPVRDTVRAEVLDVKPKLRHLVLDVSGWRLPISGRYLCGHDEFHWFVASVPLERRSGTVRGAMEALKPDAVRREQKRRGVKHRRYRRKTAAYVRQGEWFFVPRPKMRVDEQLVERYGALARQGGKPHRVEFLFRAASGEGVFARGSVSHADHHTIRLDVWHRVFENQEARESQEAVLESQERSFTRMAYVD